MWASHTVTTPRLAQTPFLYDRTHNGWWYLTGDVTNGLKQFLRIRLVYHYQRLSVLPPPLNIVPVVWEWCKSCCVRGRCTAPQPCLAQDSEPDAKVESFIQQFDVEALLSGTPKQLIRSASSSRRGCVSLSSAGMHSAEHVAKEVRRMIRRARDLMQEGTQSTKTGTQRE